MSRPTPDRPCVFCGKPQAAAHAPFCSAGCRDRDLLNWLGDGYAVPGDELGEADDAVPGGTDDAEAGGGRGR